MEEAAVMVSCIVSLETHMQRKATSYPLACPQPCSADTQGRAEPVSQGNSLCHRWWTGSRMAWWNILRTEAVRFPGGGSGSVCWSGWRVGLAACMRKKPFLETKTVFLWSRLSCVLDQWPLTGELLIKLRKVGNCSQCWAHCFFISPPSLWTVYDITVCSSIMQDSSLPVSKYSYHRNLQLCCNRWFWSPPL